METIKVKKNDGRTISFTDEELGELKGRLRGTILLPDQDGYEEARKVWNGMIDKHPSIIARCAGVADVISAVKFAREHDLLLSVKAGGHNAAGKAICDQGLTIDLSLMKEVRVDPDAKIARVQAGARWGDFDHETQAFGLATTGGVDSRTGVAGLTLGGGIGYLARSYGLAVDNLISADVVTADGKLIHASKDENPDLFWAIRGGGGNFGVVTSFEFQLHDVGPEVSVAQVFHPFENAGKALAFYRDFMDEAPDEVSCYCILVRVPPVEPFPEEYHGKPSVALVGCYSGPAEEAEVHLKPLQNFGNPILVAVMPMPYTALQQAFDAGTPDGQRYYGKSQYLGELPDEAIDVLVKYGEQLQGPFTTAFLEPMGGAINQVGQTETAYPHRNAAYNFAVQAGWGDPGKDEENTQWVRAFNDEMTSFSTGGAYVNYLSTDDKAKSAYGENYDRLAEIKTKYDPDNFFSINQNIKPSLNEKVED